jgi:hypothetical protein
MQTFVPYDTFALSAACLDYRRLGKQRVETYQLLRANLGIAGGWKNHPAAVMWRDNPNGLIAYGVAMCDEWVKRGYKDTTKEKILALGESNALDLPWWWGDEAVHSSHRSNLLRKDAVWYSQWEWEDDPNAPYVWPALVA